MESARWAPARIGRSNLGIYGTRLAFRAADSMSRSVAIDAGGRTSRYFGLRGDFPDLTGRAPNPLSV
jgi:hypothetical protein